MAQKAHFVVARACLNPEWLTATDTARYAVMTLANLASCARYRDDLNQIGTLQICAQAKLQPDDITRSLAICTERNLNEHRGEMFFIVT
jgi:hypothetical protein